MHSKLSSEMTASGNGSECKCQLLSCFIAATIWPVDIETTSALTYQDVISSIILIPEPSNWQQSEWWGLEQFQSVFLWTCQIGPCQETRARSQLEEQERYTWWQWTGWSSKWNWGPGWWWQDYQREICCVPQAAWEVRIIVPATWTLLLPLQLLWQEDRTPLWICAQAEV